MWTLLLVALFCFSLGSLSYWLTYAVIFVRSWIEKKPRKDVLLPYVFSCICLPFDIDYYYHMNNQRYFAYLEYGRLHWFINSEFWECANKAKVHFLMSSASIRYRREINLFALIEVHTKFLGYQGRDIFLEQRIISKTTGNKLHLMMIWCIDRFYPRIRSCYRSSSYEIIKRRIIREGP
eukprot:TRINITY_DN6188_c0_g1_i3.p1 TRINITY_DN6188_c0_g1~~TRINITY_DN6188_c0_g1_i3.p1  ORF type:complete len:179 (-),score=1.89 TRINITY_DN6188_c0_g1_i3:276-812(-)